MKYIILFILISLSLLGYSTDTIAPIKSGIVLLKNTSNLLPLKDLELLSISYSNPEIELYGNRYTRNEGEKKVVITVNTNIKIQSTIKILILLGDKVKIKKNQLKQYEAIIYSELENSEILDLITQKIFGGRGFIDTLNHKVYGFNKGEGIITKGNLRLSFGKASDAGIDSTYLFEKIDSIAQLSINSNSTPGIQVLIARNGRVILHKTYGYLTYDMKEPVKKNLLYDFASITKIVGALPILMQLYDQGEFSLQSTMGTYLPYFSKGNKKNLHYKSILSHNAQLKAWIPYWKTAEKKNGKFKKNTLSHDSTKNYSIKIAKKLYIHKNYRDIIYKQIRNSKLNKNSGYVYSGLSFYLYPDVIEKITNQDYETYVKNNIYKPLGASSITYNPLRYFPLKRIVPTEIDSFFRMTLIRGTVHDEGAAMMNGISANAGLFGTTLDLAKIMQMYLWKGQYGGKKFITENTVDLFTTCHYCSEGNRRGLGFDKPAINAEEDRSTAMDASMMSFGHSGYTGTFVWADPENGTLFIFMSNRVYPTRENRKIYEYNIRPAMHQIIYDAIRKFEK